MNTLHVVLASSFADPADVAAYEKAKAEGKTDQQAFKVGDNGIGQFGKVTAQDVTPMVALHSDDMVAEWGSIKASAHKPVSVTMNGETFTATVEDRCGVRNRIDCNPACAKRANLKPPFLVHATWRRV